MLINTDQICTVNTCFKSKERFINWLGRSSIFGITLRKAGFYDTFGIGSPERMSKDKIIKRKCVIYGRTVYNKPHLIIKMSNKQHITLWFDSKADMLDELNKPEYEKLKIVDC